MKIYVGNLSFNTADQELQALFTTYGQVDSVRLIRDHATGQSRGFGFVEMADASAGRAACTALDQQEFEGRRLTVSEAKPQEQRSGNGSGFGRKRELAGNDRTRVEHPRPEPVNRPRDDRSFHRHHGVP